MQAQMPLHLKTWLDVSELEIVFGFSKTTQQSMRKNGTLPYSKLGGNIRYKKSKIEDVLENHNIEKTGT